MKVVFLLRRDAQDKPGGDSSKVLRYIERLSEIGINAELIYNRRLLRRLSPDIVHLVNLDLPAENLANARAAKAVGAKVALSTIRHPFSGVKDFYQHGNDRLYRKLRRAGIPATRGVGFRELIKRGIARDRAAILGLRKYTSLQLELLNSVDLVFPMAPGELNSLRNDFIFTATTMTVENALSFQSEPISVQERDYDIITLGRIEPRKNSLELAKLAARSPAHKIAFAGQLNNRHPEYIRSFLEIVRSNRNIFYLGKLPHDKVRVALQRSSIYVNPAWFEVVSQADFEAIAVGLPILTTTQSYLPDFIEGGGWISPQTFHRVCESGESGLEALIPLARRAELTLPSRTWAEASDEIATAYRRLLT